VPETALPDAPPEPILVVAVSARMLAELAVAAGHRVVAVDRYGDVDLRRLCPTVTAPGGGLEALVRAAGPLDAPSVVYGAGFENRPALVGRLGEGRSVLGSPPETLAAVRDPVALGAALRAGGFAAPRTLAAAEAPERAALQGRWLRKPLRGGAGRGVREWRDGRLARSAFAQERVAGLSCSATAVGDGRDATLLGVSEQLIGERVLGGTAFRWCGNLVPARLGAGEAATLEREAAALCGHLAASFGLRGLFGADLVWDGARAWTVEVNPRPTGSLEVLEAAYGGGAFGAHLAGCAGRLPGAERWATPRTAAGKAILYTRRELVVGDTSAWPAHGIADVPHPGERLPAGSPVCSLRSTAGTPEEVWERLATEAARVRGLLSRERAPA
jgi:uncharacterized protein